MRESMEADSICYCCRWAPVWQARVANGIPRPFQQSIDGAGSLMSRPQLWPWRSRPDRLALALGGGRTGRGSRAQWGCACAATLCFPAKLSQAGWLASATSEPATGWPKGDWPASEQELAGGRRREFRLESEGEREREEPSGRLSWLAFKSMKRRPRNLVRKLETSYIFTLQAPLKLEGQT